MSDQMNSALDAHEPIIQLVSSTFGYTEDDEPVVFVREDAASDLLDREQEWPWVELLLTESDADCLADQLHAACKDLRQPPEQQELIRLRVLNAHARNKAAARG